MPDLFKIAQKHKVFEIETNLSVLAKNYGIIIEYLPKFHSELSVIEGVWAQVTKKSYGT